MSKHIFSKSAGLLCSVKGDKYSVETFSKPKIVEVIRHEPIDLKVEDCSWYCPQRVSNKTQIYDYWSGSEKKLVDVEYKK